MTDSTPPPARTGDQKIALITGTSSGIGLATALALAEAGWLPIATMRDPSSAARLRTAADAAGLHIDVQRLDVTDHESIEAVLAHIQSRYGRLDAVVNNAGSAALGTIEMMTIAEVRASMEVNFLGAVAVTKASLPHLRASNGRVLSVSSISGGAGQPFNEAYCAAKFALEGFMESLHPVARTVGVHISVVEPGAVSSDFVDNAAIDIDALLERAGVYRPALRRSLDRTLRQFDPAAAQRCDEVAAVIVGSLETEDPPFRTQTSPAAQWFVGVKLSDLDGTRLTDLTSAWVAA